MEKSIAEQLELFNFMKKLNFFSMLNKSALWPLTNLAVVRRFKSGELLIKENSDPVGIFILQNGKVEVFKTLQDGNEFKLTELTSGQIIGEISVIDKLKTTASVRAVGEVECIFISEWDFTSQIHAYPEICLQLLQVLAERLRTMHERIQ